MINCIIDSNQFVDCTTQQDASGINDVTVRVTDSEGLFAERTFRVTLTPVNDQPTFLQNLVNLTVDEDAQLYYDVNCTDIDNVTLIYYANKSVIIIFILN